MSSIILGIMLLAAAALIWGGITILQRARTSAEPRAKGWLMLLLAVVILGNAAIWMVPDGSGVAPVNRSLTDQ